MSSEILAIFVSSLLTFLQVMESSAKSVGENYRTPSRDSYNDMKEELKKISEKMALDKADMMRMFEDMAMRARGEEERRRGREERGGKERGGGETEGGPREAREAPPPGRRV